MSHSRLLRYLLVPSSAGGLATAAWLGWRHQPEDGPGPAAVLPWRRQLLAESSGPSVGGHGARYHQHPESRLDPHGMSFPRSEWDFNWDRCQPTAPESSADGAESKVPKASRHLLLIRHGQYNLKGQTDQERALTELGREQATLTGQRLAELNLPLNKIIQSSMTRAKETADLISKELPNEIPMGEPDDVLREGAPVRPEPDVASWRAEIDYYQDGSRIESAFRKYFHRSSPDQKEDSYELMVCHANVIRFFVCRALQLPPEAWLRISLKHASITWVTIRPDGRVAVMCLGDAGHFPPTKLTTS